MPTGGAYAHLQGILLDFGIAIKELKPQHSELA
jgi:hypothetical protein